MREIDTQLYLKKAVLTYPMLTIIFVSQKFKQIVLLVMFWKYRIKVTRKQTIES